MPEANGRGARLNTILSIASLAVSVVGLGSIWLTYSNLRDARAVARTNTHQLMVKQAWDLNELLLDHPELRPFFRDGRPVSPEHGEFNKVAIMAEMRLDAYDALLTFPQLFGDHEVQGWKNTIKFELAHSPITCQTLATTLNNYSDDIVSLAREACGSHFPAGAR